MNALWYENVTLPKFNSLNKDCKTDVLIIGGGITGLLTAYFLQQKGIDYILVEKDRICRGTTGNTTAKITYQHNLIYNSIIKNVSAEQAKAYLDANKNAFSLYKKLCQDIDCDYEIKDSYVYSLNDRKKIENEIRALDKIGCEAKFYSEIKLPIKIAGAVCIPKQAQFHPLKFLSHIAEKLNVYENTFVREMIGNTAVTNNHKIKADKVIVTTHFPFINKHGGYFVKLYQNRSYVIALENAQDIDGMYIDESQKGLSFRNYNDLLLIGGGAHRTGKSSGAWSELRSFAATKYPAAKEVAYWAAQDCMSLDNMPYIGHYSKSTTDLYTATGFNKWGMTGAMLAADILSDMVADTENAYADVFSPSRSILYPQLAVNAFEAVTNLVTISKKRCPHLGCALKWNNAEHSWDCPCHGSRFAENGRVIDNPANGDLKIN